MNDDKFRTSRQSTTRLTRLSTQETEDGKRKLDEVLMCDGFDLGLPSSSAFYQVPGSSWKSDAATNQECVCDGCRGMRR